MTIFPDVHEIYYALVLPFLPRSVFVAMEVFFFFFSFLSPLQREFDIFEGDSPRQDGS